MTNELDIVDSNLESDEAAIALLSKEAFDKGDIDLAIAAAPSWSGKVGETIQGTVIAIDTGKYELPSKGTLVYPIIYLNTSTEILAVHAIPQVLRDELKRRKPQIGDTLRFGSFGDRVSKEGTTYHLTVLIKETSAIKSFDWDKE